MSTPPHPNTRFCAYTKVDGKKCGTPAWQDFDHCWHHHGLKSRFEAKQFSLPALDDANAVQVATMDVLNALVTRRIDRADAYALFYGLYLAKSNLKGTTLSPPTPNDLAEMLEKTRRESYAAGREEGRIESERAQANKREEHEESLAALLLRELRESALTPDDPRTNPDPSARFPARDDLGRPLDPATGKPEPEWWTKKMTR